MVKPKLIIDSDVRIQAIRVRSAARRERSTARSVPTSSGRADSDGPPARPPA